MGQAPSLPDEEPTTFAPRLPPSPSTYAKFLASQTFSHLPPDSRAQFSHEHHQHLGPAQGVWDCPQKSERIEDRLGHCFTVRGEEDVLDLRDVNTADGKSGNEVLRFGTRDHSERLLVGEEPLVFTKGDAFGILISIGLLVALVAAACGVRWVLKLGKRLRADRRERADREARGRVLRECQMAIRRGRSASVVRVRRGGFLDVLPQEVREELIRETSNSRERAREASAAGGGGEEKYVGGEYLAAKPYVDDWHPIIDDEEGQGDGFIEVDLSPKKEWASDFNGDLMLLRA